MLKKIFFLFAVCGALFFSSFRDTNIAEALVSVNQTAEVHDCHAAQNDAKADTENPHACCDEGVACASNACGRHVMFPVTGKNFALLRTNKTTADTGVRLHNHSLNLETLIRPPIFA